MNRTKGKFWVKDEKYPTFDDYLKSEPNHSGKNLQIRYIDFSERESERTRLYHLLISEQLRQRAAKQSLDDADYRVGIVLAAIEDLGIT
jgi:hypothetical protein